MAIFNKKYTKSLLEDYRIDRLSKEQKEKGKDSYSGSSSSNNTYKNDKNINRTYAKYYLKKYNEYKKDKSEMLAKNALDFAQRHAKISNDASSVLKGRKSGELKKPTRNESNSGQKEAKKIKHDDIEFLKDEHNKNKKIPNFDNSTNINIPVL